MIACKISTVRRRSSPKASLSSDCVFSAPLWFVKKSDRLQNFHCAIALFFLCAFALDRKAIVKSPVIARLIF
ncbi:hypothetical protein [Nostoc sp.]